jgi:hypothetical protein
MIVKAATHLSVARFFAFAATELFGGGLLPASVADKGAI